MKKLSAWIFASLMSLTAIMPSIVPFANMIEKTSVSQVGGESEQDPIVQDEPEEEEEAEDDVIPYENAISSTTALENYNVQKTVEINADYLSSLSVINKSYVSNITVDSSELYYHNLPDEYTQVEYIESTGFQWINTDYVPTSNPKVIMDVYWSDTVQNCEIFGFSTKDYRINAEGNEIYYNYGSTSATQANYNIFNQRVTIEAGSNLIIDGSTVISNASGSFSSNAEKIMLLKGNHGVCAYAKIYSCQIKNGDSVVRDFVPCYKNSTFEFGLYDVVNDKFYTNDGAGKFNEKAFNFADTTYRNLPSGYTQVKYLQSTGEQYIDTGYYANGRSSFEVEYSGVISSGVLFGGYNDSWQTGYGYYINYNGSPWVHYYSNDEVTNSFFSSAKLNISIGNVYINGDYKCGNNEKTFACNYTTYIFGGNWAGQRVEQILKVKISSFKIYDNEILVRDFVPCFNSKGIFGLYDIADHTGQSGYENYDPFYTNQGTGAFNTNKAITSSDSAYRALPSGYTQIEYLESTGTQWIDTGVTPGINTTVFAEFSPTSGNSYKDNVSIFGAGKNYESASGGNWYFFNLYQGMFRLQAGAGETEYDAISYTINQKYNVKLSYMSMVIDGSVISRPSSKINWDSEATSISTLKIFARNTNFDNVEGAYSCCKMYSCKIYSNYGFSSSTLLRDFVPCINPQGIFGLYDIADHTGQSGYENYDPFYTNQGTGSFNKFCPQNVVSTGSSNYANLPSDYTQVEFIESTGEQWIDTGISDFRSVTGKISIEKKTGSDGNNDYVFGTYYSDAEDTREVFLAITNDDKFWFYDYEKEYGYPPDVNISGKAPLATEQIVDFRLYFSNTTSYFSTGTVNKTSNVGSGAYPIYNMPLFAKRDGTSAYDHISMKLYSMKFYGSSNTVIRNFVPCYKNSTYEFGLYDTAQGVFYTNQGSGYFNYDYDIGMMYPYTHSLEGSGTEENPYQIGSLYDLEYARNIAGFNSQKHYVLTDDIDFNDGQFAKNETSGNIEYHEGESGELVYWVPWDSLRNCTIDGQGHKIKGFYGASLVSLAVANSTIEDLHFENAYSNSTNTGHGIICVLAEDEATIENCSNDGWVINVNGCAGLVFDAQNSTIRNCKNSASCCSNSSHQSAGIVGQTYMTTIENCVNEGEITYGSGIVHRFTANGTGLIENCENRGKCGDSGIVDSAYGVVKNCTNAGECQYGIGNAIEIRDCKNYGTCTHGIGGGNKVENCENYGECQYGIGNATEIRNCKNYALKQSGEVYGIGYDVGQNNIVENCVNYASCASATKYMGIGQFKTIKNCVNYGNATIENGTNSSIALGIGRAMQIDSCVNYGTMKSISGTSSSIQLAGICSSSSSNSRITNCVNRGDILSDTGVRAGGVLGNTSNYTNVINCQNYGNINVNESDYDSYVGGIVGVGGKKSKIIDCANYGKLTGSFVGGISLMLTGEQDIVGCSNYGKINGSYPSGINCGYSNQITVNIRNCVNYGEVDSSSASPSNSAGISRTGQGEITNCINYGKVSGYAIANVGTPKIITNCMNYGEVGSGFAHSGATISNCINISKIGGLQKNRYWGSDFSAFYKNRKTGKIGLKSLDGVGKFMAGIDVDTDFASFTKIA